MIEKIKTFNSSNNITPLSPNIRALDILSEAGEVGKEVILIEEYGTASFKVTDGLKSELGDLLYATISFANEHDINLYECLDLSLKKYTKRLKDNKHIGNGGKV